MTKAELKKARLKSGLSQEKAARINQVSTSYWQKLESGLRPIPADFVLVLPKGKNDSHK